MSLIQRLLRGAVRDRLLTAINITGMAIGLAVGFLILAFALQEYDHDTRWPDADRMYRVDAFSEDDGQRTHWADTPYRLADDLRDSGTGIDAASVFLPDFSVVRAGSVLEYNRIWYVHPSFLDLFGVDVLAGDVQQALRSPESVVLTASEALRYVPFGSPIGELIEINIEGTFKSFRVDAVVEDPPTWSSLHWGILLPYETALTQPGKARQHDAGQGQAATFVRLAEGTRADDVVLPGHERLSFFLTPVEDMYFLNEASTMGIVRNGDKQRADVLFTRDLGVAALLLGIPRALRPPVVYESHGYAPEVSAALPDLIPDAARPSARKLRRLASREEKVWREADGYVTITQGLADELTRRFGPRPRLAVVPDGARGSDTGQTRVRPESDPSLTRV